MSKDGKSFISNLIGKRRCPYHEPKSYTGRGGHIPVSPDFCNCDKPIQSKRSGSGTSQDVD